jgi:hypothetical protein
MRIIARQDGEPLRGDFAAQPGALGLVLPNVVARALATLGVRTAEDLLAYTLTFPSAVAAALHWDIYDVEQARNGLVNQLHGFVDDRLLAPETPEERVLGAFDPKSISGK